MHMALCFKTLAEDRKTKARVGKLRTAHGAIETPFFMPVTTKGTAKQLSQEELQKTKTETIICNALLLSLRPGLDIIQNAGGLHDFIRWDKVIFTDSGGFQMVSKNFLKKVTKNAIHFRSPYDQQEIVMTPERAIMVENSLGADVAMTLDHVEHYLRDKKRIQEAMETTHRWAAQCIDAHTNKKQLLFGITQGGTFADLRAASAKAINGMDFDGVALGGLCLGESKEIMHRMVELSVPLLDEHKPRYLMGVGTPKDLVEAVALGIDIFDSCFPTRTARHGLSFCAGKNIDITKKQWSRDKSSLDKNCVCAVCKTFSKAYIHHLFRSHEFMGQRYVSYHNIAFIQQVVKEIRQAIREGTFAEYRKKYR